MQVKDLPVGDRPRERLLELRRRPQGSFNCQFGLRTELLCCVQQAPVAHCSPVEEFGNRRVDDVLVRPRLGDLDDRS